MKQYIGTKIVGAWPCYRVTMPGGEREYAEQGDVVDAAGKVEEGYRVQYEDGYLSWSPKAVFEKAYRETHGMSFGLAIEAAKMGKKIARAGWNGKGMYVFLADINEMHTDADLSEFEDQDVTCNDVLVMRTAQAELQPGWLASQADMLADDWRIVE